MKPRYPSFHRASFSRQLTVIMSVAIIALALSSSLVNSWQASQRMRGYLIEQGLQITENLARQSTLALLYQAADNAREGVATTLAFPDVQQVDIVDVRQRVLLSQTKPGVTRPEAAWRPSALVRGRATLERETDADWEFGAPVYANQAESSPFELADRKPQLLGHVHVVLGKATLNRLVASLMFGSLAITLLLSLIVLGILRLLAQHLIGPLNALSALMRRAEGGESGLRAKPAGPRDIIDMATAFNKMMAVLEEREVELQRSRDQALHTAQLKAQFAATVSHEVRTPLNGLVGMLDMLKEMRLSQPQRECVEVAWNSSHTLMGLINGILDFSKLEAGKLELDETDFTIRDLVQEVIDLLASQAQHKGVALRYQSAADVPGWIKSDPLRLRQVLINLVGNAIKFTAQGEVVVRLAREVPRGDGLSLRIEVSDTGIGMDADAAQQVFESYAQADRSTSRQYGGTGLGLAICKQLVELFGGEIGVTSRRGQGSTFWFTLPCQQSEALPVVTSPSPAPAKATTGAVKEYRVLVVEDNRTNQVVAAGMLGMSGCRCEVAVDGREALDAVRRERFDLIFMDCGMPDMDGYEATASIRLVEAALGRHTPIIAMTGNVQPGSVERCLAAGMDDYLAKPITLVGLRQKLAQWLTPGAQPAPEHAPERHFATTPDSPLDLVVFEKLRQTLGVALQHAVTPFLEDMPGYLTQLEQAMTQGDADALQALAHAIKGSAGNLGANGVQQLAKDVEELAREQRLPAIPPLLPRLRGAFDAVAAVLRMEVYVEDRLRLKQEEEAALVLVVEDDRSTRTTIRYLLQHDGFQVEEAENGAQALALLKRLQPDIILMDAVMPVLDGFAACAQLQEQLPPDRSIPVLMITALDDTRSVERAFAAGASDFLTKPIHGAVLSQRVRRIVEASRAEKRIRHLAYKDALTGLPNRTLFFEQLAGRIEQARNANEELAVLFLDLNRFKYINDTLGHDVGDRLLTAVAHRIRGSVRSVDFVARLGGDEFAVVLANVSGPNAAATAAQNICRALASPFQIDEHNIFVAASVGISLCPSDATDAGALLKHADTAMYRAKKTHAGFQFFEAGMERQLSDQVRLENDLRQALERDEFELFYQPQASLEGGHIVGMEALVRWRHPERGMVSPVEFIPLAEETGLINALGAWVLRTACTQLKSWLDAGLPSLRVAVNLSVKQLLQKGFDAEVAKVLADTGLPPKLLELEITESTLMEQAQDTALALNRLRDLGVRLSIDDFGTGYSSLAYLKRFPVGILKIDRSFVQDLPDNADDAAIVTAIIALAHSLRLEVVAEGVETEAQLAFLREQSCDLLQGYFLSKPLPAEQFVSFVRAAAKLPLAG